MVKNSVMIKNLEEYMFRLEVDDIKGIIRLTKNRKQSKTTRITERNIPINIYTKWKFHNKRSGYNEIPNDTYNFIGSYIDRSKNAVLYNDWKKFVYNRYSQLKKNQEVSNESR